MTPQFLRSEAARFREMAEVAEREASRQRLLAMAADYDARAKIAEDTQPPEQAHVAEPEPAPAEVTEAPPAEKGQVRRRLRLSRTTT